jgi:hypothetical protein
LIGEPSPDGVGDSRSQAAGLLVVEGSFGIVSVINLIFVLFVAPTPNLVVRPFRRIDLIRESLPHGHPDASSQSKLLLFPSSIDRGRELPIHEIHH